MPSLLNITDHRYRAVEQPSPPKKFLRGSPHPTKTLVIMPSQRFSTFTAPDIGHLKRNCVVRWENPEGENAFTFCWLVGFHSCFYFHLITHLHHRTAKPHQNQKIDSTTLNHLWKININLQYKNRMHFLVHKFLNDEWKTKRNNWQLYT